MILITIGICNIIFLAFDDRLCIVEMAKSCKIRISKTPINNCNYYFCYCSLHGTIGIGINQKLRNNSYLEKSFINHSYNSFLNHLN